VNRAWTPLRSLLATIAAVDLVVGLYATIAPHPFYNNVLGVDPLGPYDEHLMTDVGGLYLGFAVLFAWAAWTLAPREHAYRTPTTASPVLGRCRQPDLAPCSALTDDSMITRYISCR
jgi:hypothetical protein